MPATTTHCEPLDTALDTVGETPLVRVQAPPPVVPVYAKLGPFNPDASLKNRIGKYMFERMLKRGDVGEAGTVVEPMAGNMGTSIAVAARQLGLNVVFITPERFSVEKQTLMRALGAEVINTPTEVGMGGAIDRAYALVDELDDAAVPQQFSNPLNAEAHYKSTAPEMARYFRKRNPETHVVAVEPEGPLYASFLGEDPAETDYKIEGIGTQDPTTNKLFDPALVDEVTSIADRDPQPADARARRIS